MASDFNSITISGRLTRKPEVKTFEGGGKMAFTGLANNRMRKDKAGDYTEEVSYYDVKFFGRQAEIAEEFLDKGREVLIQGRIENETWEKDGKKNTKTVVIVEQFKMFGAKKAEGAVASEVSETVKKK